MEFLLVRRALLSVTDKTGLAAFASFLVSRGVELVSTGGTQKALEAAGIQVTPVSRVTSFPEVLNGRVKTLHPYIHAGILADKENPEHMQTLASMETRPFDLVCVNLYNFSGALEKKLGERETIEEIDIGGPCLIRASAKNFHSVLVLPGTEFYEEAAKELEENDMHVSLALRRKTAAAAFAATSAYDAVVAGWLCGLN